MGLVLGEGVTQVLIPLASVIGTGFALLQWLLVSKVKLSATPAEDNGHYDSLIDRDEEENINNYEVVHKCAEIQHAISVGATSFLFAEYKFLAIFMCAFCVIIFLFLGSVNSFSLENQPCAYIKGEMCKPALANAFFSTIAFFLGALTSTLSGFLGMKIATYANARTTLEARKGVGKAFITTFRSGAVMGFLLAANGLLVLYISINLFRIHLG